MPPTRFLLLAVLIPGVLYGAELDLAEVGEPDPIVTDRPDFTESASTVAPDRIQLELGYRFSFNNDDRVQDRTHSFPEILIRVGLLDNVELRLGWNYVLLRSRDGHIDVQENVIRTATVSEEDGGEDLSLGFKYRLLQGAEVIPDLAVIGAVTVPTGAKSLSAHAATGQINLLYAWTLSDRIGLAGSTGVSFLTEDSDFFLEVHQSLSVAFTITDWLGAFVEYFAFLPFDRRAGNAPSHHLDGGFTFPVTDDLQFDIAAGIGLNRSAEDGFLGAGMAIRF